MSENTYTPVITSAIIAVIFGALGGYGAAKYTLPEFDGKAHPPVAVIDYTQLLDSRNSRQAMEQTKKILESRAIKLRDAGWLVLDNRAVVAAPKQLLVPVD